MEFDSMLTAISTVGFPIVMCIVICIYVKYMMDKNAEQMTKITDDHKEEVKEMTKAIENNTIVITQLVERLGKED